MKKMSAILLALMLCMGVALAEDVTGTWYLNELIVGETSQHPDVLGLGMTMTLNADGTAVVTMDGEDTEGTWVMEDGSAVVTMAGDPMAFAPVDGTLVADAGTMQMVFGKEKAEAQRFVAGEIKADATMEDYQGGWGVTLVEMNGMQISVDALGMSMVVNIEDGKALIVEGAGEEITAVEGNAVLVEGKISVQDEAGEEVLLLQLHEGDVLSYTMDMGEGTMMNFYFERMVEQAAN